MTTHPQEINPNTYYTPDEAASLLRIPKRAARQLLESGVAQGIKIGRYWRVLGSDLLQLTQRETLSDADLTRWAMRLSEPAFSKVWNNEEDALYDAL